MKNVSRCPSTKAAGALVLIALAASGCAPGAPMESGMSVAAARMAQASVQRSTAIALMKAGQMTPYTSGLMFTPPPSGNDPDSAIM